MKKKVVFIMGTAHCGSSLLNLVLDSHTDCLGLGELSNLPNFYRRQKPLCSVCQGDCSFWHHHFSQQEMQLLSQGFADQRIHKYIPLQLEKTVRGWLKKDRPFNPYSLIANKVNETVLIDSTKTVYWLKRKLDAREFKENLLDVYLVHLIRDGRAVMGSYSRRKEYQGLTAQQFGQQFGDLWKNRLTNENNFFNNFTGHKLELRYETFATQPEQTAQEICQWLDIEFQPDMLNYKTHEHHPISGNSGTHDSVKQYQKGKAAIARNKPSEQTISSGINLNVRWPQTLSPEQIAAFYQTTAGMNKAYEWQ